MTASKVINVEFDRGKVDADAYKELTESIAEAIDKAHEQGLYYCVIVALLQAYLHDETRRMIDE